jgi:hypothetical protein
MDHALVDVGVDGEWIQMSVQRVDRFDFTGDPSVLGRLAEGIALARIC